MMSSHNLYQVSMAIAKLESEDSWLKVACSQKQMIKARHQKIILLW
ncbi:MULTISPECIES: hypothetical protein [Nostocaceae]|uniref:Uncharacterized protein n=1 Tax=Trichormus variabilis N2B TaxID=2681315 RepID=A0ABR6S6N1_ANAVA|nr:MULTISPECIES: hypothetical protein [Nostocaceae]MBC1302062.1 hypothetical protein [Trichormus variabilis N2B]MBC1326357.1 hypothetical protein [Trichormus variabilis 9RC]MBD2382869.1 hypothetical protein [Trichormus variabilis FACHB-319]